jgi:cytidyltransferase-like protein
MKRIVLVTGGFDPLHSGHIEYFEAASKLGDMLIVGINTDDWLVRKKGQAFMEEYERCRIIESLKVVDKVVCYPDADGSSKNTITGVRAMYPDATIIFANGGDRTKENIHEMDLVDDKLEFVFGVGGNTKKNSSSWILEEWKSIKTSRTWGYYQVLYDVNGCKVKELTIEPGQSLSMQRHLKRHEFWHVAEGQCVLEQQLTSGYALPMLTLTQHSQVVIPLGNWHKIHNPFEAVCRIVEIQYGTECIEEDIERKQ